MVRSWFYVVDDGAHWEVRDSGGVVLGERHSSRDDAVSAAIQLARNAWKTGREPCGVRIQSLSGPWHDVTKFGEGSPDAAG